MTVDPLDELPELLRQCAARNLYTRIREFLRSQDIKPGIGWAKIRQAIEERRAVAGFEDFLTAFRAFIRDAALVSYKRLYVLSACEGDPSGIMKSVPDDFRRDYLAARPPKLAPEVESLFLESRTVKDATVYTFVSSRPVRRTVDVDPATLNEEVRSKYEGAQIVARYEVELRCYDHLIQRGSTTLLLIDAPESVDGAILSRAEVNYGAAIAEKLSVSGSPAGFTDLFPAIGNLWQNKTEGIVNGLEFVSNKRAQIGGRFSPTSMENYRTHEFQTAGEKGGAQVSPYRIAVKWPERNDAPMVVLPGRPSMVMSGTAESGGGQRPALNYMSFPTNTEWEGFSFALDRVLAHLGGVPS